jgi:hypothetical protein
MTSNDDYDYTNDIETVRDKLLSSFDTAEVLVFEDGTRDDSVAHIGYYAASDNGVWPSALRYIQSQGFVIMESMMRYLDDSDERSFPERGDRELCYVEAKRERPEAPEVYR